MAKKLNYDNRNFRDYRESLLDFIRENYPEIADAITDSSVGEMLVSLNAAIGDTLSNAVDHNFNETQLQSVQERKNILALARNFGYKQTGKRSAITLVDFIVNVPVDGDTYDESYLPIIRPGTQVLGGGRTFEVTEEIDFSSNFSARGVGNRTIEPIPAADGSIESYDILKREILTEGQTLIYSQVVNSNNYKPFFELVIPEARYNVVSIEQVIVKDGVNFSTNPSISEFTSQANRWYEVDSLAEQRVFIEDGNSDVDGVKNGKWIQTDNKFVVEYNNNGNPVLTFGNGNVDPDLASQIGNSQFINLLNNSALGNTPPINSTIFVRYRIGGGVESNVGPDILTALGNVDMFVNGSDPQKVAEVRNSLRANNPIPAYGGSNEPTVEEIRKYISWRYSSHNRAVTVRDYIDQALRMPPKFGTPFRVNAKEDSNKVKLYTLYLDQNNKLINESTDAQKNNIANWLSYFRMINDYVEITDGKIFNLEFLIRVQIDRSYNKADIIAQIVSEVQDYMNIQNRFMGDNLYLGKLRARLNCDNIEGLLNVVDIRVFNKVGQGGVNDYSRDEVPQAFVDESTKEIKLIEQTIFGATEGMFEVKFPERDIKIAVAQA